MDTLFIADTLRITCSFSNPIQVKNKRSCTVSIGSGQEQSCDQLSQTLRNEYTVSANQSHVSVDLPTIYFPTESVSKTRCFVVIASDGLLTVESKGMLTVSIAGTHLC